MTSIETLKVTYNNVLGYFIATLAGAMAVLIVKYFSGANELTRSDIDDKSLNVDQEIDSISDNGVGNEESKESEAAETLNVAADDSIEDENEPVFDPLNKELLKERMSTNFPGTYLTMVSVIQGVAVGILTQNTLDFFNKSDIASFLHILPFALVSLLAIMIVSFEYVWFTGIYRWSIKFWDVVTPIMLGITEVSTLFFLNEPAYWWLAHSIFTLFGTLAFFRTYLNCDKKMFSSQTLVGYTQDSLFDYIERDIVKSMCITASASIVCFIGFRLFWMDNQDLMLQWGVYILYTLILIVLVYKDTKFVETLHNAYGLEFYTKRKKLRTKERCSVC